MAEIKNVYGMTKNRGSRKQQKRKFTDNVQIMIENLLWYLYKIFSNVSAWIGNVILASAPFVTLFCCKYVYDFRGYSAIGGEVFVPIILVITGFILKSYARVSGNDHVDLPVPYRRFTQVDDDNGQVDVDYNRVQEMILYMADLEDWFERNGYK